jgi:CubicO group peptidase (beta-lactamase class C family)
MQRYLTSVALLALLCLTGIFASFAQHRTQAFPKYSKEVEDRIKHVENGLLLPVVTKGTAPELHKLSDRMKYFTTPAVSIAVINNGRIEWAKGYGAIELGKGEPATANTLFCAGSISKPVTAMGALHLVQEGKLDLDEDVNSKLISWKVPENEYTKQSKVTLRRLLNHTSGLGLGAGSGKTWRYGDPFPTLVQALNGTPPADNTPAQVEFTPNCKWMYSSTGYAVAQLLMMDVTKMPFPELMQTMLFNKLGMASSTFQNPLPSSLWNKAATGYVSATGNPIDNKYPSTAAMAAGGLWTTPGDLARFAIELQKTKQGLSASVLSQESANLMLTPFRAGWSLGLEINTEGRTPRFSHSGGMPGFTSYMVAYQWEGKGAVVMVNQDTYNGFQIVNEIMLGIAREYGWQDYKPLERPIVAINPAVYKNYAGYYEIDQGYPVTIASQNNSLYLIWALGNVYRMNPLSKTKFWIAREGAPTYEFIKDDKNEVIAVKREWNGGTAEGKRIFIPAPIMNGKTSFRLRGFSDALTVSISGSFNKWDSRQALLKKEQGEWVGKMDLPAGKHLYRFVVDNKFMPDPQNPLQETDNEGNICSVLIVQ